MEKCLSLGRILFIKLAYNNQNAANGSSDALIARPFAGRYMVKMKFLLLLSVLFSHSVGAVPRAIVVGDNVSVNAQVQGCGDEVLPVEYAKVLESGDAIFFDNIRLKLVSLTEGQVASKISDKIGEVTGSRPKTLQVKVVPQADPKTNSLWLLRLLNTKPIPCQPRRILPPEVPTDYPKWKEEFLLAGAWPYKFKNLRSLRSLGCARPF